MITLTTFVKQRQNERGEVRVADQVPGQASEAIHKNIERAIDRNDAAIERIQAKPDPGEPNPAPEHHLGP